jgi:hypothetical protein
MQTKIYGNSNSDGFPLYTGLITALFVAGGVGLAKVGAAVLLAGIPMFAVLVALMAMKLAKWDVMSPAPTPVDASAAEVTTFPVAAQSDSTPDVASAPWSPSKDSEASLPAAVMKPKSTVETNTNVA